MKKSNRFVWELGDIEITKPKSKKLEPVEKCSRCGIPIFMALKFYVIKEKDVCEACLTVTEGRRILSDRYKKLCLDDSELKKGKSNAKH